MTITCVPALKHWAIQISALSGHGEGVPETGQAGLERRIRPSHQVPIK